MKDQLRQAEKTLGRVAAVFLILWFIGVVTDIMGRYEYELQFLQLAVGFYLLSKIPTAFRHQYTTGKKVQKFFTKIGWPLIGLWIAFKIFRWIGWFGAMEIGVDIDYFLVVGFIFLLIGHGVKSVRHKAGYWAVRSVLFAIGGVSIFFWVLIKVFSIFTAYADIVLVTGIVAVGIGFILGGLKKPPPFLSEISEEEFGEPEISEEVFVTKKDFSITRDTTRIKVSEGSLFIPIVAGKEMGGIYFGEGSYHVDAKVKTYTDVYRGVTTISGNEWNSVREGQTLVPADEEAFENIGLKKEEVLEIARLQLRGKITDEVRKRLKKTEIDLPFLKVRETPHGEYVKVGPLEFKGTKDEEHVRIGPWEFRETGHPDRFSRRGLFIQIRSKDEDITISTNGKTTFTKGDMLIVVNDKIIVREEDIDLVIDEDRKVLRSGKFKLICKDERRILESDGFELSVSEDKGRIRKNGKSAVITDEKALEEIRIEIDAVTDELIREVLDRGELKELDVLIKKFEQEIS